MTLFKQGSPFSKEAGIHRGPGRFRGRREEGRGSEDPVPYYGLKIPYSINSCSLYPYNFGTISMNPYFQYP